jgi:hypothetical protein
VCFCALSTARYVFPGPACTLSTAFLVSRPVAAAASVKARSEREICGAVPEVHGFGWEGLTPASVSRVTLPNALHVKHGFVYP